MKTAAILATGLLQVTASDSPAPLPVLKRSDVVFMYQASRPTNEDYGTTILAWGGNTPIVLLKFVGLDSFTSFAVHRLQSSGFSFRTSN